jgi:hypothetical protein
MKKGLFVCLTLMMVLAMAASAAKLDPRKLDSKDGQTVVRQAPKALPSIGLLVSPTGYGDAWRGTASMASKSIVSDPTGVNIGMAFGVASSPCNLVFATSTDSGASFTLDTRATNMNVRIYNGIAMADDGTPFIVWQDRTKNSIQWAKDFGGFAGGLWTDPDTLTRDTVAW